jgi:hypothetical protein
VSLQGDFLFVDTSTVDMEEKGKDTRRQNEETPPKRHKLPNHKVKQRGSIAWCIKQACLKGESTK